MFERSSCIEGAANQGDNLNNIGISIENFRLTWDSGFDRAEPSSLETVSHMHYVLLECSNWLFRV